MNWADERAAFEARLSGGFSALPVQYPGLSYDPVAGGWVRFATKPGPTQRISLGTHGTFRIPGLVIMSIYTPSKQGSNAARVVADQLSALFTEVRFSLGNSGLITTWQPRLDDVGTTGDGLWYQVNLTVQYWRDVILA